MFIGDGAKMVRDAFALAKEKQPCIIFIDEIDSIGAPRPVCLHGHASRSPLWAAPRHAVHEPAPKWL